MQTSISVFSVISCQKNSDDDRKPVIPTPLILSHTTLAAMFFCEWVKESGQTVYLMSGRRIACHAKSHSSSLTLEISHEATNSSIWNDVLVFWHRNDLCRFHFLVDLHATEFHDKQSRSHFTKPIVADFNLNPQTGLLLSIASAIHRSAVPPWLRIFL